MQKNEIRKNDLQGEVYREPRKHLSCMVISATFVKLEVKESRYFQHKR